MYRVPTFTELYYTSPANNGDPNLQAETGWTWDSGVEYYNGAWSGNLTYFERYENNLIEWARLVPAAGLDPDPWQATNLGEGTVRGAEFRAGWQTGRGDALSASYVGLDKTTTLPAGMEGKYSLLTPEHQGLSLTVTGRYLEHSDGPSDFRHSFALDNQLDWRHPSGWFGTITGTNLLDRRYEEVPGVRMPGTLYTTTVGRSF